MTVTILITSTQYPGYGGAATNAYALIKSLRNKGYNTCGIFFHDGNVNADPDNIGNILRFDCGPFDRMDMNAIDTYRTIAKNTFKIDPILTLNKNYRAPFYTNLLYPNVKNVYLISGINHIPMFFPNLSVQEFLKLNTPIPNFQHEIDAINVSTLVVANSSISLEVFRKIYPTYPHKIYPRPVDTTKEIESLITQHNNSTITKQYDFAIIASGLTRSDKNLLFLINILQQPMFNKYSKIIIGENNSAFRNIPNSTVLDILPHKEVLEYMKKSKILLYPSLNDANPNTVREAVYFKCIALVSNNIGHYEKFPYYSICKNFNRDEWTIKMLCVVENYHEFIKRYNINFNSDEDLVTLIGKLI